MTAHQVLAVHQGHQGVAVVQERLVEAVGQVGQKYQLDSEVLPKCRLMVPSKQWHADLS